MSNEIFKWQPDLIDVSGGSTFNVVKTPFENGMSQRALVSERETFNFKFRYQNHLYRGNSTIGSKLKNEIRAFWKARQGAYDNFFLPCWELETRLDQAKDKGLSYLGMSIGLDDTITPQDLGFSAVEGEAGNEIYLCKTFARGFEVTTIHEINRITYMNFNGNVWIISLDEPLTNDYPAGTYIQKAYKVNFDMEELPHTMNIPDAVTYDLSFKEDIASSYQSTFGV